MVSSHRDHALLLGGSITGLLTARVLADHYARITIVERDRLPSTVEHRHGLVGANLALPGVTGPALTDSPLTGEYVGRLQLAATEDATLAAAFIRVTSLIDPPTALLHPDIVERVNRTAFSRV
jgi:hypothetical protein